MQLSPYLILLTWSCKKKKKKMGWFIILNFLKKFTIFNHFKENFNDFPKFFKRFLNVFFLQLLIFLEYFKYFLHFI